MSISGTCFGKTLKWHHRHFHLAPLHCQVDKGYMSLPLAGLLRQTLYVSYAAVCRHQVPVAAVNLIKTGERYAYSHFLLTEKLLASNPPIFIHQDIACKLTPWRHKVSAAFEREELHLNATAAGQRIAATTSAASRVVDVLPEAHGLLHSWSCQVF